MRTKICAQRSAALNWAWSTAATGRRSSSTCSIAGMLLVASATSCRAQAMALLGSSIGGGDSDKAAFDRPVRFVAGPAAVQVGAREVVVEHLAAAIELDAAYARASIVDAAAGIEF